MRKLSVVSCVEGFPSLYHIYIYIYIGGIILLQWEHLLGGDFYSCRRRKEMTGFFELTPPAERITLFWLKLQSREDVIFVVL